MKKAVCILIVNDGKFLSVSRRNELKWGLPGGKVDPGETELEAIIREVKEETNLDLNPVDLISLYSSWCPPMDDNNYFWATTYFVDAEVNLEQVMTVEPGVNVEWRKMSEFDSVNNLFKAYNTKVLDNYHLIKNPFFESE